MKNATIALIAHDGKKDALVDFVSQNCDWFSGFNLVGTGTTGGRIAQKGIDIECLASGPLGGDAQIAARITEGNVHAVIFSAIPWENIRTSQTSICCCVSVTSSTFPWPQTWPRLSF